MGYHAKLILDFVTPNPNLVSYQSIIKMQRYFEKSRSSFVHSRKEVGLFPRDTVAYWFWKIHLIIWKETTFSNYYNVVLLHRLKTKIISYKKDSFQLLLSSKNSITSQRYYADRSLKKLIGSRPSAIWSREFLASKKPGICLRG